MQLKNRIISIIIIACFTLFMFLVSGIYESEHCLVTTECNITTSHLTSSLRIVHLSDQHNSTFGENNAELITLVASQRPDLILITGDILNANEQTTEVAEETIKQLVEIAPVYISMGNHELEYEENYGVDIEALYESCGATVLEQEYVDIEINGQQLRIGGIYSYLVPESYYDPGYVNLEDLLFMEHFLDTDRYTILLDHMPYSFLKLEGLNEWDVDCVFSGHVHGGQIILPLIGGVYAPDLGWWPGKLSGVYESEGGQSHMVLSRGLGSTEVIPRFNNVPEVVVVDLLPEISSEGTM